MKTQLNTIKIFFFKWPIVFIYFGCTLLFREVHPFSFYPMYNEFPNWSYVFYITDKENKLVNTKLFNKYNGDLMHMFCTICENKKIIYGNGVESKEDLRMVSEIIFKTLAVQNKNLAKTQPILKMHRIFFFYKNGILKKTDQVIYESHL